MIYSDVVSFDDEKLIVVDEQDRILDYRTKAECHHGEGILHRAFSIFIFSGPGELILQKRSAHKKLWPGFWSNSCCSHPRKGETLADASRRRLKEELGLDIELEFLYNFQYHARFGTIGSERELCAVLIGKSILPPLINKNEIAEWKYITVEELTGELQNNAGIYTPWLKMEWQQLTADYRDRILNL